MGSTVRIHPPIAHHPTCQRVGERAAGSPTGVTAKGRRTLSQAGSPTFAGRIPLRQAPPGMVRFRPEESGTHTRACKGERRGLGSRGPVFPSSTLNWISILAVLLFRSG